MNSKFFAVLLVCVLATMSCAFHAEAKPKAKPIEIRVVNNSMQTIYFAFAREGHGDDVTTRGWYKVERRNIDAVFKPFNYNPDDYYFWYAFAEGGEQVWKGDDFTGWIHPKDAFKSERNRRIPGGKKLGFRQLQVPKDGKVKLSFD